MDDSALYQAIGTALQNQPDVNNKDEFYRWLGRAGAIVGIESTTFAAELQAAQTVYLGNNEWHLLQVANTVLYKAMALVELRLPVQQQSSFIQAGKELDGFASVAKVLKEATTEVWLVDPYMDETLLTNFAVLVDEAVSVRLLSDENYVYPAFEPAVRRFKTQFGTKRPLEARITPPRALHDRLIFLDGKEAFAVTQSFKDLAKRSHASILKVDAELAALKHPAYEDLWAAAKVV